MSSASELVERCSVVFKMLLKTDLCINKKPTDENMGIFANIMNMSLPMNPEEKVLSSVFRTMCTKNIGYYLNYLQKSEQSHMALLSGHYPTIILLGLKGVVEVRYNPTTNKYDVSRASREDGQASPARKPNAGTPKGSPKDKSKYNKKKQLGSAGAKPKDNKPARVENDWAAMMESADKFCEEEITFGHGDSSDEPKSHQSDEKNNVPTVTIEPTDLML